MEDIKFKGYQPALQLFRTEGNFARVSFEISRDEYQNVRDFPLLEKDCMYEIIIKKISENG